MHIRDQKRAFPNGGLDRGPSTSHTRGRCLSATGKGAIHIANWKGGESISHTGKDLVHIPN